MAKGTPAKNAAAPQQPQQHQANNKGKQPHPSARHPPKKSTGVSSGNNLNPPHQHSIVPEANQDGALSAKADAATHRSIVPNRPDTAETDVDGDEKKIKEHTVRDSTSSPNHPDKHGEKSGRGGGRFIIKNLWDVCCNETESEVKELDTILKKLGLPSVNYSKTKAYEMTDYEFAPDIQQCKSKDFLDFYVFPYLLPAIQALIQFARVNRVFQCRFCTFNALDYIVEYLYNNNPRYPERLTNPVPIFEIPFARAWLEKHPRKPPPRWMLMSSEEAAIIIQRAIRGYMVRVRPEVQEMRQFWREYRKDIEEEKAYYQYGKILPKNFPAAAIFSPYYEEYRGEFEESCESPCNQFPYGDGPPSPTVSHHSDHCVYCQSFRKFLDSQPEEILKSYQRPSSTDNASANGDQPARLSSAGNEEMGGSAEGLTTDTGGEEDNSHKEKGPRKESGQGVVQPPQIQEPLLSATSSKAKGQKLPAASIAQKSFTVAKSKLDKKARKQTND